MGGSKNTGMRTKRLTHVFIPMNGEEGVHECAEAWWSGDKHPHPTHTYSFTSSFCRSATWSLKDPSFWQ